MKKLVVMGVLTIALAGCTTPYSNLTEKMIFACETLDGEAVTVAVDIGAAMVGHTNTVSLIRTLRQEACARIGAQPANH